MALQGSSRTVWIPSLADPKAASIAVKKLQQELGFESGGEPREGARLLSIQCVQHACFLLVCSACMH